MIPRAFHFIVRDVLRSFKSDKLAIALAFVIMAIGLAAATVTLSVVDTIFLHPLPYRAPGEIVEISQLERNSGRSRAFTYRFFYEALGRLPGVKAISPLSFSDMILQRDDQSDNGPAVISGVACSASLFEVLELKPLRGRLFDRTEETSDANVSVALISEELWGSRYGKDPGTLGKKIRLNERQFTIIGIMRGGLRLPPSPSAPAVWIPLGSDPLIAQVKKMFPSKWDRSAYLTPLWARIDNGLNIKAAEEQIRATGLPLLAQDDPDRSPEADIRITAVEEQLKSKYRVEIYVLLLAAFLTLAVSCFNVSSFILARSLSRQVEVSIRMALGESLSQMAARVLLEGLLISISGALAGGLIARVSLRALASTIPDGLLLYREIVLGAATLIVVFAGATACGVGVSLWPVLRLVRLGRGNLLECLRGNSTEGRSIRLNRRIVVVAQVTCAALSFVLFLSLFRSYRNISATRLGFNPDPVMVANLRLPQSATSGERWKQLGALFINNLASQEGVVSAAVAISAPVARSLRTSYTIPGKPSQGPAGIAEYRAVGSNYFSALGIPIRKGHGFSDSDTSKTRPVCILNEALTRSQFVEGQEIGARIAPLGMEPCEVIGVVGDVAAYNLRDRPAPAIYVPFDQMPNEAIQGFMCVLVRTNGDGSRSNLNYHKTLLANVIRQTAPALPASVRPLAAIVAERSSLERFRAILMGIVSLIALILTACGVYGIAANYVVERRRDITIRLAIGATTRHVIAFILKDNLILAAVGLILGLSGAYPLLKVLSGVLFGITALDMSTIAACALMILVIVSLSAYIPTRRILRLSIADVLKDV